MEEWNVLFRWGSRFLIALGVVVLVVFLPYQFVRQFRFLIGGEQTAALVVSDVTCSRGSELTTCHGDVRYRTTNGGVVTSDVDLPTSAKKGDAYSITYLRDDPSEATTLTTRPLVVAVGFFAATIVLGLLGAWKGLRHVLTTREGREYPLQPPE